MNMPLDIHKETILQLTEKDLEASDEKIIEALSMLLEDGFSDYCDKTIGKKLVLAEA